MSGSSPGAGADVPESDGRVVDQEAISRLRSWGGDALLGRMIGLFIELGPERTRALEEGAASGDMERVERAAHSLKSSAANLGADDLRERAGRLEAAAAGKGDDGQVPRLVDELLQSYRATVGALETLRPDEPEPSKGDET